MPLFYFDPSKYVRHTDMFAQALTDNAKFLSVMTGSDLDYCKDWVKTNFKATGAFPLKNPNVVHTQRKENGDREEVTTPLYKYLDEVFKNKHLLSGTGTIYYPPEIVRSPFTDDIDNKKKTRSAIKKKEEYYGMIRNTHLENTAKSEQISLKTKTNSYSGAALVETCPLYLSTMHPTLTITCRITANNGGAVLDKFIAGNRHYRDKDITINAIVNTVTMSDIPAIAAVLEKYNLHIPTVDECFGVILKSSRRYWKDITYGKKYEKLILEFISKCTDVERVAIVYVGDFYHLAQFNPEFTKDFIFSITNVPTIIFDEPDKVILDSGDDLLEFGIYRHRSRLKGVRIKDRSVILKTLETDPDLIHSLATTIYWMKKRFSDISDIIFSLWATNVGPHSIASFPDSVRVRVPAGDTDSSFFSVMDYVKIVHGKFMFTDLEWGTAGTVACMAASLVTHQLYQMQSNFGVVGDTIKVINMKNEFGYSAFIPSQASKHYFAARDVKEGNVLPEYVLESKGVSLISSDGPEEIVTGAINLQKYVLDEIKKGNDISLVELLVSVANTERKIINSILSGEGVYLRSQRTNAASAYKEKELNSTYKLHGLWNSTFGKFSDTEMIPPYTHKVIPVDLNSKSKINNWLENISDADLRNAIDEFLIANDMKGGLGTLRIPEAYLSKNNIPAEIASRAKIRSIVQKLMTRFYLVLESLGFYAFESGQSMLVSDYY